MTKRLPASTGAGMTLARRSTVLLLLGLAASAAVCAHADDASMQVGVSGSLHSLAGRLARTLQESSGLDVQIRLLPSGSAAIGDVDVVLTTDARGARRDATVFDERSLAFGADAMVLAYARTGRFADAIAEGTPWFEALAAETTRFGRGDPESPLGLRALFVLDLAGRHYGNPHLALEILRPGQGMPGDVLVRRLEAATLDAALVYRSQATRAGLAHLDLPDDIDLGDPGREGVYAEATVDLDGKTRRGAPIVLVALTPKAPGRAARAAPLLDLLQSDDAAPLLEREGYVVPPGLPRRSARARPQPLPR